ncbi:hypothetical protein DSECCO2_512300 [anaerobic digester metagenome]
MQMHNKQFAVVPKRRNANVSLFPNHENAFFLTQCKGRLSNFVIIGIHRNHVGSGGQIIF